MPECSALQSKFIWLARSLGGSSVDDHNVWYLLKLYIQRVGLSLDEVEIAMPHKVPVALITFVAEELHHKVCIWFKELLCFLLGLDVCEKVATRPCL